MTKKHFLGTFISCSLILLLVLSCFVDPNAVAYAAAPSPTGKNASGYLDRNSVQVNTLKNTNTISLNFRSLKLVKGTSAYLKAQNIPAGYTVSFQSNNTKIASVTSSGKITGRKNGTTTIIATIKSNNRSIRKLSCSVEVGPNAISIVIPKSQLSLKLGKSSQLKYIMKSSNSVEVPKFTTSNKKVATITKSGVIQTHGTGKAVITATIANGKSDKITVTVTKK